MKGCARSCILWLLGWGAAAYAFYRYFVTLRDFGPPMYWASAIAGLLVVAVIGYALGIATTYRERAMLLDAIAGTPPEDGQWVALSGTIHATTPLTGPISGARAVMYEYRISKTQRATKGGTTEVVLYEGKALVPSTIATRQGSVRLLALPALNEIPAATVSSAEALKNARQYAAKTQFTFYDTGKKRTARLEEEWTDDDGNFRQDRQHSPAELELTEDLHYEEKHIAPGEPVCAFGLYSRARGGLIPHPNWSKHTRITRGDATTVAGALRYRMVRYLIGIVICSAAVYGIVRLYEHQAATLPL